MEYEMLYKYNVLLPSVSLMHVWHSRARYPHILAASYGEIVSLRTCLCRR